MRYFEIQKPRIEIIPMIDIMLFLLVFFVMIALKMIPSSGLIGHLPSSTATDSLPQTKVVVEIHHDGQLMVDQQPMSLTSMRAKLKDMAAGKPGKTVVTIAGAANVSMQQLADVMDACRQSGISQIGLATRNVQ